MTTTTSAPFIRSGIYSAGTTAPAGSAYSYITDYYYDVTDTCSSGGLPGNLCSAYANESDERNISGAWATTANPSASVGGRNNVLQLTSSGSCNANPNAANSSRNRVGNSTPPIYSFCSVFGPEVASEAFYATTADALSFEWAAQRVNDDYEIYAYLVQVQSLSDTVSDDDTHTVVAHSLGQNAAWTTSSAPIPTDGYYRFRFVNGSYDGTGGLLLGSNMYIDPTISVSLINAASFVVFAGNGGTGVMPPQAESEPTPLAPNAFTREGFAFTGWNTAPNGSGTFYANEAVFPFSSDATLYAQWSRDSLPEDPPGPPTDVTAIPGNSQAAVSWTAPWYPGSQQIIGYRATASPGGQSCEVRVPPTSPPIPLATTCTVTGLTNGTAYTFTVQAYNAVGGYSGGWGLPSLPSAPVIPIAAPAPSPTPTPTPSPTPSPSPSPSPVPSPAVTIQITGSRDGGRVSVTGSTSGLSAGSRVTAQYRVAASGEFRPGMSVGVGQTGNFSWGRKLSPRKALWVYFTAGDATSTVVELAAASR